ncbi:MAG: DUF2480 family protein [Chitinophagales bacterium]
MEPIVNKVAQKAIISIDLADYVPGDGAIQPIDLKDFLYRELLLREGEFREKVAGFDFELFRNKFVVLHCSADAIVPSWAYMILSAQLAGIAKDVICSPPAHAKEVFLYRQIARITAEDYRDKRVVVKGCGDDAIDAAAFVYVAQQLTPVVRALSYGEPCSMVPVYKR